MNFIVTGRALAAVLLGVLILLPGICAAAAPEADLLPAGEAAPPIEGVGLDGKPFSLAEELSRGPVFLVFWSIF